MEYPAASAQEKPKVIQRRKVIVGYSASHIVMKRRRTEHQHRTEIEVVTHAAQLIIDDRVFRDVDPSPFMALFIIIAVNQLRSSPFQHLKKTADSMLTKTIGSGLQTQHHISRLCMFAHLPESIRRREPFRLQERATLRSLLL